MSLQDPNAVNPAPKKQVAVVIANPATSTTTGWPVGFWWSELTPWFHLLAESGYQIQVFSPDGGACKADALSNPRDASRYSATNIIAMVFIRHTILRCADRAHEAVTDIDADRFDAILVAGGQAQMFTFETATALTKSRGVLRARDVTGALCHGVAILEYARLSTGDTWQRERRSPASPTSKKTSPTRPCGT